MRSISFGGANVDLKPNVHRQIGEGLPAAGVTKEERACLFMLRCHGLYLQ